MNEFSDKMLLTVCVPVEWVTVMLPGRSITTSSFGPGSVLLVQFVVVFQSPLPPIQETVAPGEASGESRRSITKSRYGQAWKEGLSRKGFIADQWLWKASSFPAAKHREYTMKAVCQSVL